MTGLAVTETSTGTGILKPADGGPGVVFDAANDDWEDRDERGLRSQYRLSFVDNTGDDEFTDGAFFFNSGENGPRLEVSYLIA